MHTSLCYGNIAGGQRLCVVSFYGRIDNCWWQNIIYVSYVLPSIAEPYEVPQFPIEQIEKKLQFQRQLNEL